MTKTDETLTSHGKAFEVEAAIHKYYGAVAGTVDKIMEGKIR